MGMEGSIRRMEFGRHRPHSSPKMESLFASTIESARSSRQISHNWNSTPPGILDMAKPLSSSESEKEAREQLESARATRWCTVPLCRCALHRRLPPHSDTQTAEKAESIVVISRSEHREGEGGRATTTNDKQDTRCKQLGLSLSVALLPPPPSCLSLGAPRPARLHRVAVARPARCNHQQPEIATPTPRGKEASPAGRRLSYLYLHSPSPATLHTAH